MALQLDLAPGDVLLIGTGTKLRVEAKTGKRMRVSIESDYRVTREPRNPTNSAKQESPPGFPGVERPK